MLSVNKPIMDNKFNTLYDVLYNASYNSYLKAEGYDKVDDAISGMVLANKPNVNSIKTLMEESAKTFADEFVNQLKNGNFLETISNEIDNHVKSTKISITASPIALSTIISPVGPCTGSLILSDETSTITLL